MSDTKISNVIGVPIPQWLVNQFNERANQNGQTARDTESLVYLSNKSAWIRAVSSVNVSKEDMDFFSKNYGISQTDPTSLAKSFVLFAGTSKYRKEDNNGFGYDLRSGLGGSYGMLGEREVNEYGYQPMPGITSVNIETSGRMGSIRMATINFKVHNKMQLDIMDALYFKLGYTLFLEWGNTCYYKTDAIHELQQFNLSIVGSTNTSNSYKKPELKYSEDLSIDPFENGLTKEKINYKIAQNVKESYGNYDGMLGVITNFNFTRKEDSSYDCSVKIIGLGVLAESIKINRSDVFVDILKNELRKIVQLSNIRKAEEIKESVKDVDQEIKTAKDELAAIQADIEKTKSINEIYVDKISKYNPFGKATTNDVNQNKNILRNNYAYLSSDNVNVSQGDINISDIVYPIDNSWAIRKLGIILDKKTSISRIVLSSEKFKKILGPSSNHFFDTLTLAETGFDYESSFIGRLTFLADRYRRYFKKYTIPITSYSGKQNVPIEYLLEFSVNTEVFTEVNTITTGINTGAGGTAISRTDRTTFVDEVASAIYKDVTEKDLEIDGSNVDYGIDDIDFVGSNNELTNMYRINYTKDGSRYRPSILIKRTVTIKDEDIIYYIQIHDSAFIKDLQIITDNSATKELLKRQNNEVIEQRQKDITDKEKSRDEKIQDNPLADVNKVQEIEVAKYASSLETILRGIQTYSLNKATDTSNSVEKVDLKPELAPKIFERMGLYSTMYKKLINGSIQDIAVEKNKQNIYEIGGSSTQQSILEYFAKYGFNHNIMSGNASPSKVQKVDYNKLLVSYVIPHQVSQEFAEGITMNRPVFIQLGTLLMILNHIALIYDVKDITKKENRTPVLYIDYNPETNYCLTVPNHLSTNPIDIMIPYNGTKQDFEALFDAKVKNKIKDIFDPKTKDNNFSGDLPEFRDRSKGDEKAYQGKIMNVLVDIQYLLNMIKKYSTSDSTNSVYLKSFIETILTDITKALGNFNVLRLAYNDASNCLYIVDDQLTPGSNNEDKTYRSQPVYRTELPLHGKRSIAKNIEIKTEVSSKLANMIAISSNAQSSQGSLSTDASSFGFVNSNFTDRYIPLKEDVDPKPKKEDKKEEADTTEGDLEVAQSFNDAIKSFYGSVDIPGDATQTATNYYMARMSRVKNETPASRASVMIPVSVNFTTDGVSGFGMYQSFTISDELLPYTYSTYNKNDNSENKLKKIGFCVVGLSHTIESNQWNTSVRAQMIYLKDSIDYKTNPIVEKLPSGPGKPSSDESTPSESSVIEEELASNLENSLAFKENSQNIKWQLQRGNTWCYIASVSMILNSYGKPVSQENIHNRFTDSSGKLDSIGVANSYGIRYNREALPNGNIDLSYNTIVNRIKERKGKPFILERKGSSGSGSHFIVVLSVDNQNRIVVFDPGKSKYAGGTYLNKENLKSVNGSLRFFDV